MLITFNTDAYESITYFDDVAKQLITLMGHSGTIPGAIMAPEVSNALHNLQKAITQEAHNSNNDNKHSKEYDDPEPKVSLAHRALPLINLLEAAKKKNCNVMWK